MAGGGRWWDKREADAGDGQGHVWGLSHSLPGGVHMAPQAAKGSRQGWGWGAAAHVEPGPKPTSGSVCLVRSGRHRRARTRNGA